MNQRSETQAQNADEAAHKHPLRNSTSVERLDDVKDGETGVCHGKENGSCMQHSLPRMQSLGGHFRVGRSVQEEGGGGR